MSLSSYHEATAELGSLLFLFSNQEFGTVIAIITVLNSYCREARSMTMSNKAFKIGTNQNLVLKFSKILYKLAKYFLYVLLE